MEKLEGHGQCSCVACEKTIGFNRHWTSMCWRVNGKVYCEEHAKEAQEYFDKFGKDKEFKKK